MPLVSRAFFGFTTPYSPTIILAACLPLFARKRVTRATLELDIDGVVARLERSLDTPRPETVPDYTMVCVYAEGDPVLHVSDRLLDRAWSLQREFELVSEELVSVPGHAEYTVELGAGPPHVIAIDAVSGTEARAELGLGFTAEAVEGATVHDELSFTVTVYPGASARIAFSDLGRPLQVRLKVDGYNGDLSVKLYRFAGVGVERRVRGRLKLYLEDGSVKTFVLGLGEKYYRVGMPLGPSGEVYMLGVY